VLLPRKLTPANVLKLKVDDMRGAGLSARKVEYLVDLALHFDSGMVHVDSWKDMADELIIDELVAIRGIGRWTAEMFLIFHLMRPNVLPVDDVGLLNGISVNYFSGDPVSRSDARDVAVAWAPIAAWRLGIFGDRSTPYRSRTEQTGEDVGETNLPRLRAAHC
jgi:DNA-3-methyladenine glycosylase II